MHGTTSRMLLDSLSRKVPLLVDAETAENLAPWLAPTDGAVHAADGEKSNPGGVR